jgi:hypothetical protein
MYPQSTESVVSAALPVIVVIALSAIVAIAITALLVRDIACRAIARANPDEVPAVLQALAAMLGPLGDYLPWSGRKGPAGLPAPGNAAQNTDSSHHELPKEDHEAQR